MPEIIFSESRPRTSGIMTTGEDMRTQQGNADYRAQERDEVLKYRTPYMVEKENR